MNDGPKVGTRIVLSDDTPWPGRAWGKGDIGTITNVDELIFYVRWDKFLDRGMLDTDFLLKRWHNQIWPLVEDEWKDLLVIKL